MRILATLSIPLLFSGALFAQHSGARGGGGFRGGGGGYHLGGGGLVGSGRRLGYSGGYGAGYGGLVVPYVYPGYFGGYYPYDYSNGYIDGNYAPAPPPAQPNVTVVYPPQQPPPAMMNQFGPGMPPPGANPGPMSPYQPSTPQAADDQSAPDHYLIALKDHTIYSVVAYWVDGDTLHYFTAGNVHNQASLSLIDRDLTARLNKESGLTVNLPPAK